MKLNQLSITSIPKGKQRVDLPLTKWVVLFSNILNEEIIVIFHKDYLPEARIDHPNTAVYFGPEIRELQRMKPSDDELKSIHLWKKECKAWILPQGSLSK